MKKQIHIMYIDKETENIVLWKCNKCPRVVEILRGKYLQVNVINEGDRDVIHKPIKSYKH